MNIEKLTPEQLIERLKRAEAETKKAKAETEEAKAETKKAKAETKKAKAETEEAKAETKKAKTETKEEKARADKAEALKNGTYYARIIDVVQGSEEDIPKDSLKVVRRKERCDRFYKTAIEAAEASQVHLRPSINASRTSGYDEGEVDEKRQRKRSFQTKGLDGTHQKAAEIAHLVPHSPKCASLYGELLEAMVGVDFDEPKKQRLQVLVHGQLGPDGKEKKTGIKHCSMNLIRVMHQKTFMDKHPSQVLFLPILTVEEVLCFGTKGHPDCYSIAVLCQSPDVYKEMVLTGEYETCTHNDLEVAVETLRRFTFAVAEHARDNVKEADLNSIVSEKSALRPARNFLEGSRVVTPNLRPTGVNPLHVLKLTLANDGKRATTCDPWLLCLKSAIMFSSFSGRKLLPGCFAPPSTLFSSTHDSWNSFSHETCGLVSSRVPSEVSAPSLAVDATSEISSCTS